MALDPDEERELAELARARDWDAVIALATSLEDHGRGEDAATVLHRAVDGGFAPASHNLGLLHQARGDLDAALASYRCAADLDYADAVVNAGRVLEDLGRLAEAEAEYRTTAASDPAAQGNLGVLLLEQGRVEEARVELTAAAARDPRKHWQLADVHLAEDDVERARAHLRLALAAGEGRAARQLAALVDQDDEQLVRTLYEHAAGAGAIGAGTDLVRYLRERGHTEEALRLAAEAVDAGDTYAPLALARLLAELPDRHDEARAMFLLAAVEGDDVRQELAELEPP